MVILADYTTLAGICLTQACLKIRRVAWNDNNSQEVIFDFDVLLLPESVVPIESNSYSFIYDLESSDNALIQSYGYLVSLERFSNVTYL